MSVRETWEEARGNVTRLFTVAAAALLLAAGASAQTGNVEITRAEAKGAHPLVSWTLAPGWCSLGIAIATSAQTGSDGSFFRENVVDSGGPFDATQTSWLSSNPSLSKPGRYYVRVAAYQCDGSQSDYAWSPVATFVVPPPPTPKVKLVVRDANDWTTGPLSTVWVGQVVAIELKGSKSGRLTMRSSGQICALTKQGNNCHAYGDAALTQVTALVTKNMVVRGAVTFSAVYENQLTLKQQVVAKKSLKVVAAKT